MADDVLDYYNTALGGGPQNYQDDPFLSYRYQQPATPSQPLDPMDKQVPIQWGATGGPQMAQLPTNDDYNRAVNSWYGMTGIPDMQQGYQSYLRGEYLPALGQAGFGAANAIGLASPFAGAGLKLAGMEGRDVLPAIRSMLGDESGAVRIPSFGRAAPDASTDVLGTIGDALRPGIGHNEPPPGPMPGDVSAPAPTPGGALGTGDFANPLTPNPDEVAARLGRKLKRDPNLGTPNNDAVELPDGIHIGNVNFDQWDNRVNQVLGSPDAIAAAGRWYKEALPAYQSYFGEEKAPQMLGAWLIANQNATPGFAQLSAIRALEQYKSGSIGSPVAGLANDRLAQWWGAMESGDPQALQGLSTGHKINDFIDSAAGSPTRTYYGNDPRAGAPAVADIHSLRDMGRIDPTMQNWVRDTYGDDVANKLQPDTDMTGGVKEVPYEWSADKMRRFTDEANARNWQGRNDWTPSEIQAIGWMTMSKLLGRQGQTAEQAITSNVRNLSYELDFGQGAPYNTQFPDWASLSNDDKASISKTVLDKAMDYANGITGAHEFARVAGSGAWNDALNPAFRSQYVASPEAVADTANIIGYLAQQTAVHDSRPFNSGKQWALRVSGPGFDDADALRQMWATVRQNHPDLAMGFSPGRTRDGLPAIDMTFNGGGQKLYGRIQNELAPTIQSEMTRLGFPDANADIYKAESRLHGNDWQENPNGEAYLERLSSRYGPDIQRRLDDFRRTQLEPTLSQAIAEAKARAGGGGQAGQTGQANQAPFGLVTARRARAPPTRRGGLGGLGGEY